MVSRTKVQADVDVRLIIDVEGRAERVEPILQRDRRRKISLMIAEIKQTNDLCHKRAESDPSTDTRSYRDLTESSTVTMIHLIHSSGLENKTLFELGPSQNKSDVILPES